MKSAIAFGACILLMTIFATDRGLPALFQAQRQAKQLTTDIARLRAENARLRRRAEALRSDPSAIEAVARETLGLVRAGEVVVITSRARVTD